MKRGGALFSVLLALLVGGRAAADGPVLHEYFEPDPKEDVMLQATAMGSDLPAAIDTPSGVVRAPDISRMPSQVEKAYGGSSTPESVDASYRIDSDTTRPDVVSYDDPFTPAVTPFKRLYAYDAVSDSLELVVEDKSMTKLSLGGVTQVSDDQFFADMTVDLEADVPVRVPSPGPMAKLLKARSQPDVKFEMLRDSADNWFIRAEQRARVRLVMQIAVPRDAFGGRFADVSFASLKPRLPALPRAVREDALEVARHIGITAGQTPRSVVQSLVAYFRGFAPSGQRPQAGGVALYKELALSKKGVCRHRAYAFMITAHAVGIPARMIRNEAHAWVEVWDGQIWHRIDLGGAAGRMELEQDQSRPAHAPPNDPYSWPEGSESGTDMAEEARSSGQQPGGNGNGAPGGETGDAGAGQSGSDPNGNASSGNAPSPLSMLTQDGGLARDEADKRPTPDMSLKLGQPDVRRGHALRVIGTVSSSSKSCGGVRVDVGLKSASGEVYLLQSISTDAEGRFDDSVMVPFHLSVGEYEVIASTPGNEHCGAALSR
ncbi:MAG: transglutaminase domain-containing protein [Polyangiaceae bacterium]